MAGASHDSDTLVSALLKQTMPLVSAWNQWRYWFFENEHSDRRRHEVVNATAPEFFSFLDDLLVDHIMLGLARLNDSGATRGQKNFTLRQIVEEVGVPPGSDALLSFRTSCDKLKDHRDKRLAHADDAVARLGWSGLATPTIGDIDAAMGALRTIVISVVEQVQGATVMEHLFEDAGGAGQIGAALEAAQMWRELRTRAREMPDAEVARVVRGGVW